MSQVGRSDIVLREGLDGRATEQDSYVLESLQRMLKSSGHRYVDRWVLLEVEGLS